MRRFLLFLLALFLVSPLVFSYPDSLRTSLNLFTSQATGFALDDDDRYLYVAFTSNIERVDLQTWELTSSQVPDLTDTKETGADLDGNIQDIALKGGFLYATQNDGDLIKIDLVDITEDQPDVYNIGAGDLGKIVADTESGDGDDKLYIADEAGSQILVFDISDRTTTSASLLNASNSTVNPGALQFVPFPTPAGAGGETDKIYITSDEGILFVLDEGGTASSFIDIDEAGGDDLSDIALSPGGNFLFVTNSTDSTVHVIDAVNEVELDTDANSGNGITPISLLENDEPSSITVADVASPDDVYAYVSGSNGVSVIDLNISGSTFISAEVLDMNDEGTSDDEDDPIAIPSSTAGPILASSETAAYVLTSKADGAITVITEKPFVTIGSTALIDSAGDTATTLASGNSFTITFQADETGSYSIKLGGDTTANGAELASGTVDTVDTDTTTASITYDDNSSTFSEGTNRIFVFVTDSDGNLGWDAFDITVDTPPTAVTVNSVGFGNTRLYLNFDRLDISDISSYNIYADLVEATAESKTDVAKSVSQPGSNGEITAAIDSLENGSLYFISIAGVDSAGNIGPRTTSSGTPEQTVGISGSLGESGGGCSLILE